MKNARGVTACVISLILLLCTFLCLTILVSALLINRATELSEVDFGSNVISTPTPTPEIRRSLNSDGVLPSITLETLEIIENTVIPESDLRDLAQRLSGVENAPETTKPPLNPLQVGTRQIFWATNTDTAESFQVDATLQYVTDHLYFWIEDGVNFDGEDLANLAGTFETEIYPTVREFFGSEWSPGVDGDPHLYILYARGLGRSVAGYFSSFDEVHPLVHEYSNAHEMFFLSADNTDLGEEYTYGVLSHEFQHMIHWNADRNEEAWVNEGFSEVATFLAGYDTGGFDSAYAINPDIQLNTWPSINEGTAPHYGAAFLFLTYFLGRFGEDATQALVAHPGNGMKGIDKVLENLDTFDLLHKVSPTADDVFQDWTIASYIQDGAIADGRFNYPDDLAFPNPPPTETIQRCPFEDSPRIVHQYGVDYIRFTCPGSYRLHFEGSTVVPVLPVDPHSGEYAFWSNRGDESDMTLTRMFDFSEHSGPLTLQFWTWYDIEEDYDYAYLEASRDGDSWQILRTPSGSGEDPSGSSYGWAYNGLSGGDGIWIEEKVDLSEFAGEKVYLRFEYITDGAVTEEGLLIDDVAIPEIDYRSDFEKGDGGWEAEGFVRIQNILPQTFRLSLITQGDTTAVEYITLDENNISEVPFHIGDGVEEVILVVSGTTRFTREQAVYQVEVKQ